ncbi:MAG: Gfo/Idh/MocA family oxidoreductase [Calditrichota bacterium]
MGDLGKVRLGLIGAGGIAQVSHIPNILGEPEVELAAICDSDVGRLTSVAKRYGISQWFDEPEQMFQKANLSAVIISTPTISHLPLCQIAFENQVDVFLEKPIARNLSEALKIVEFAESNQRLLMLGMNHRFREDTKHLKRALAEGLLGDLLAVRSGWLKRLGVWGRPYWFTDPKIAGGGVLLDLGLQMIDLTLYLLDFPAAIEVNCGISSEVLGLKVEDTAAVFIRFETGVTFTLEVSWAECNDQDIAYTHFAGSHGGASLNPLRLTRRVGDRVVVGGVPTFGDEVDLYRRSFRVEISHFIESVKTRRQPLSSGRDALPALEIVSKLYRAAGI